MSVILRTILRPAHGKTMHGGRQKQPIALVVMDRTYLLQKNSSYQNAVFEATERKQDIKHSAAGKRQPETLLQTPVPQP